MGRPKHLFFKENVFNDEFDYYYLFDYFKEFYQDDFFKKITLLSNSNNITYIDCWLELNLTINKAMFSTSYFLNTLYNREPLEEAGMFEYFLQDETLLWKFYTLHFDDICIVGVHKKIKSKFEKILEPYSSISLLEKIDDVVSTYGRTERERLWAKQQLLKLYRLSPARADV